MSKLLKYPIENYFVEPKAHQIDPINNLVDFLMNNSRSGILLEGGTGVGKTIIAATVCRILQDREFLLKKSDKLASIMYLGPNPKQSQRVFYKAGVKNTMFLNYPALRSSTGELFINWETIMERGEIEHIPVWDSSELPDLIIADEIQRLKNPASKQTECFLAAVEAGVPCIMMSATPFQKACEAETIFRATKLSSKQGAKSDLRHIALGDITINSPVQTKRIKEELQRAQRYIQVKNARFPFPVKFNVTTTTFRNDEERKFYNLAYQIYLKERAAQGKMGTPQGIRAKQVAMQKFWEAQEILKSFVLAETGFKRFNEFNGTKQILIATNFVTPLRNVWRQLVNLGVPKDRICVVIGGQSANERQAQVDKYQSGDADFLLMTVASGGESLDLPNDSEKNRPRHAIVPICWSVFKFLQVIGRIHRMSSRSISTEEIIIFKDTIEESDVKPRLEIKLACIHELKDRKDSFIMDIFNQGADKEMNEEVEKEFETPNTDSEKDADTEDSLFDVSMLEVIKE